MLKNLKTTFLDIRLILLDRITYISHMLKGPMLWHGKYGAMVIYGSCTGKNPVIQ